MARGAEFPGARLTPSKRSPNARDRGGNGLTTFGAGRFPGADRHGASSNRGDDAPAGGPVKSIGTTLLGLLCVGGLFVTQHAAAEGEAPSTPAAGPAMGSATPPLDTEPDDPDDPSVARRKRWGLMFDVGSVDGGLLSLLYRPAPWLRLHAGGGTNDVSAGYRAGVTVASAEGGPSLNIEGGHFLPGDMNGLLKILVGTGYQANPRLEHFDYDFINVHAGWEVESGNLIFFARGGASVLWTRIPALAGAEAPGTATTTGTEPFWLLVPSVAFGFIGLL
jgi:hypothetical protein